MSTWIGAHLFYHADPHPLLTECVSPLVSDLRQQDLISRYFFIRYWENGPHVRLRLQPAQPGVEDHIRQLVTCRAEDFFKRRPALYPLNAERMAPMYKLLFIAEYGESAYVEKYGDGVVPVDDNNSMRFVDYVPEFSRYGGVRGVDLAEWHFEGSSDITLSMLKDPNTKLREIQLGLALQVLLLQAYAMWKTDERVHAYVCKHFDHWQNIAIPENGRESRAKRYEKRWAHQGQKVTEKVSHVRALIHGERAPIEFERTWLEHCDGLATAVSRLLDDGGFELPDGVSGLDGAMKYLFPHYFHMTANRIGVSIEDEVYLAFLARRGLESVMEAGVHA